MRIFFFFIIIFLIFFTFTSSSYEEIGIASWYGPAFHGKKTANGEIFDTNDYTAAHKTLPFGSIIKVISLENNKSTIVRINDRGPFKEDRIIDLSRKAAEELDMIKTGTMRVKTILLETGNNKYHRFSSQKYCIQIASFSDREKANDFAAKLREKNFEAEILKFKLEKIYYRVIINNLNYYSLQKNRVRLFKEGINNYLVKKKY